MADPVTDPVAEHDARYGEEGAGPPEWARVRDRSESGFSYLGDNDITGMSDRWPGPGPGPGPGAVPRGDRPTHHRHRIPVRANRRKAHMTSDNVPGRSGSLGNSGTLSGSVSDKDHSYRDKPGNHIHANAIQVPIVADVLHQGGYCPDDERGAEHHLPLTTTRAHKRQSIPYLRPVLGLPWAEVNLDYGELHVSWQLQRIAGNLLHRRPSRNPQTRHSPCRTSASPP